VSVRDGTSVKAVAERYQVKEDDVLALNKISDRNSLSGRIRIPAYGHDRQPLAADAPRPGPRLQQIVAQPPPQTVAAPPQPLQQMASAAPPSRARVDAAPLPPPPSSSQGTRVVSVQPRAPEAQQQTQPQAQPTQPQAQTQAGEEQSWWSALISPTSPPPAAAPMQKFIWPVDGRIISPFGQRPDGSRNDGINISARHGSPVRAADAGTVTYVGNELKGYGNLVLIRHDNGYITAYAHAERIDVQRGERVSRGQVIGEAGQTGDVSEPQVHFEIRLGTRPVDPTPYLVDRMAAND